MVILGQDSQQPGPGDCLSAVADIQFAENVGCVGFNSSTGYDQHPGNLLVGFPGRNQLEHFQLAWTQRLNQPLSRSLTMGHEPGEFLVYVRSRNPVRLQIGRADVWRSP